VIAVSDLAIEVRGLTKSYGDNDAVKGVDLDVQAGEVFALLGPNGAGKTTIVEILEGHRARSGGSVHVLGHDPGRGELAFRQRVGIVLQETGVERFLTVAEVIEEFRGFYPDPLPLDDVIHLVGLEEKRDERVGRLSGGQQRRLDVAIGLAGNPDLLFLDEPTTGFDPGARRGAWEMVRGLQSLGKTVFLTTHYMDEAQELADRVAVIVAGNIVAEGPPSTLAERESMDTTVRFHLPEGVAAPPMAEPVGDHWTFETATPTRALHELTSWALDAGVELGGLSVNEPSLEDVYLRLTGGAAQVEADAEPEPVAARGRRRRSSR
jgi:ABC-2 type transport system ATP-binding protein